MNAETARKTVESVIAGWTRDRDKLENFGYDRVQVYIAAWADAARVHLTLNKEDFFEEESLLARANDARAFHLRKSIIDSVLFRLKTDGFSVLENEGQYTISWSKE